MKTLRFYIFTFIGLCASFVALICYADYSLSRTIQTFEHDVIAAARTFPLPTPEHMQRLPLPVQRYFTFTFPNGFPETKQYAIYKMEGMFRRPLTQKFEPTLARQVASLSLPDMVFSATTPILGPIWATVYDRFMNGEMEMVAKLLSIFSVVHEDRNAHLNQISLRRWLLESPTFPIALLPGPVVSWHPIDDNHALAVAKAHGIKAELIATFGPNGELLSFDATQGGDLNTPYHGSGERVSRSDYQKIENMRIPMTFEISRIGKNGIVHPFWRGRIQDITFAP